MGKLTTFGGNGIVTRHRRANYGDNCGAISMRCLSCEKLRYVAPVELRRAAMPRCLDCGGPLEEIDCSRKRRGLTVKAKAAIEISKQLTPRCKSCGRKMGSGIVGFSDALRFHLSTKAECLQYYDEANYKRELGGVVVIAGSESVTKVNGKFAITALTAAGAEVTVMRGFTKRYLEGCIAGE